VALPENQNGGQNGGHYLQMAISEVLYVMKT
jgi:hypothetical protein